MDTHPVILMCEEEEAPKLHLWAIFWKKKGISSIQFDAPLTCCCLVRPHLWCVGIDLDDLPSARWRGREYFRLSEVTRELMFARRCDRGTGDRSRQRNKDSQIWIWRLLPAHGLWQVCLSRCGQEWQLPLSQQAKLVIALRGSHDIFQSFDQAKSVQTKQEFVLDRQLDLHHLQVSCVYWQHHHSAKQSQGVSLVYGDFSL